jgi:hypothetical protein
MAGSASLRVRCPRCGETLWREHKGGRGRLAKRTSLALDWHRADVVDRVCQCGPLRINAHQLLIDVLLARRAGRPFVFAAEAVPEARP